MASASELKSTIDETFRDFNTDGVPASQAYDPEKPEIRTLLKSMVDFAVSSGTTLVFATVADMNASPDPTEVGARAEVRADPGGDTTDHNGIWGWDGSAWQWISSLIPADIGTALDGKAEKTVTVSGGGLVTGGGDLSANLTLTVTKASSAEVLAGTDETKAMTPLSAAAAFAAKAAATDVSALQGIVTAPTGRLFGLGGNGDLNTRINAAAAEASGRTTKTGFLWGIFDKLTGKAAAGLDDDGLWNASGLKMKAKPAARTVINSIFSLDFGNGLSSFMVGVDGFLRLVVASMRMVTTVRRTTSTVYYPIVESRNGKSLLGFTAMGELVARISTDMAQDIADKIGTSLLTFRGSWNSFNVVRQGSGVLTGDVIDEVYRIIPACQKSEGSETVLARVGTVLKAVTVEGQSNAGAVPGTPILTESLRKNTVMQAGVFASRGDQPSATPVASYDDIEPLAYDPIRISFIHQRAAYALEDMQRAAGTISPVVYGNSYYGGADITEINLGTVNFDNVSNFVTALPDLATAYGYDGAEVGACIWIHGEHERTGYQALLNTMIDDRRGQIETALSQSTPPWIMLQVNSTINTTTEYVVPFDLLQVARDRASEGVYLAGPMYYGLLGDSAHGTEITRCMEGDLLGFVMHWVLDLGRPWVPVWPVSVDRTGTLVDIVFAVPQGMKLEWDTDWVAAATAYGFQAYDSGGTAIPITSVEITGRDTVQVTLSDATLASGGRIGYAFRGYSADIIYTNGTDTTDGGWPLQRGQLYADTGIISSWWQRGVVIPKTIRLYATRFVETMT